MAVQRAARDKNDDIIPTMLKTNVRRRAVLKLYVSINIADQRFAATELLTLNFIVEQRTGI